MQNVIVTDNPKNWPLHVPGVPVIAARTYLTDTQYSEVRSLKLFNLCRSLRYQTVGYYVSLLAMARGHKPFPSVTTIQDTKSLAISRIIAEDLDELMQKSLTRLTLGRFSLSIYFGRNLAKQHDELSSRLFRLFPAPLLRAEFKRDEDEWRLTGVRTLGANDIPTSHHPFAVLAATEFFARKRGPAAVHRTSTYELAILHDPDDPMPPSNREALRRFAAAAKRLRFGVEFVTREDFGRIAEFDALFIRETTQVNHHTYRFARRAAAEGLVVIDDPDSITKCTNKVYLAELLARHNVPAPKTLVVHRDNRETVGNALGWPCILKQPDSSFSLGVIKADNNEQCRTILDEMFEKSELIIAQEFVPTDHDWRIVVLGHDALFACKYHMVPRHWQIVQTAGARTRFGKVEAVPLDDVPAPVLKAAVRACALIGKGLYGVDVKALNGRVMVVEVNDNPNVDAGCEDAVLKRELYDRVMRCFLERIRAARADRPDAAS
jgi:glutathione synthase/RimK-type ligase-like ATP-grasp enzyme